MKSKLLKRTLTKNLVLIRKASDSVKSDNPSGVSEWLLDNLHLIEQNGRNAVEFFSRPNNFPEEFGLKLYNICRASVVGRGLSEALAENLRLSGKNFTNRELSSIPSMCVYCAVESVVAAAESDDLNLMESAVGSLYALKDLDCEALVSEFSVCEKIFSKDPSGEYLRMTAQTKAYYREQCSVQAEETGVSEEEYAEAVLERARQSTDPEKRHIGFHLLTNTRHDRRLRNRGIAFLAVRIFLPFVISSIITRISGLWWLGWFIYIPIHEAVRPLIEWTFSKGIGPRFLPRMEISDKIPDSAKTLAVVSCLVPSPQNAGGLCAHLNELIRSNDDKNIGFCLLADLKESAVPTLPEDSAAVDALARETKKLEKIYGRRIMLAVRRRVRVKTQDAFSGWERKRGAITELVRFIKTGKQDFLCFYGDPDFIKKTRFLLLLDSDTDLPFNAAGELVSAAVHPLNRPRISSDGKIVERGYGILAPLIATDIESAGKSLFSRIMSGAGGINAYNAPCGDLYQDMFGISVFCGKGLVNVDAFYSCLDRSLPTERILSHDILEGAYLRCALASDVEFTDGCPSTAKGFDRRLHRWIRGDIQNVLWLLPRIAVEGKSEKNPITLLNKIFLSDNVNRALCPAMCFATFVIAALNQKLSVTLFVIALLGVISRELFFCIRALMTGGISMFTQKYYSNLMPAARNTLVRAVFNLVTLVTVSVTCISGALSGLYRQFISKKRLLEWTTAADADKGRSETLLQYIRDGAVSVAAGIIFICFFPTAFKLLGIAFVSCPLLLFFSKNKPHNDRYVFSECQRERLISYASSMWKYYDELCNEKENFLPPDNLQESPVFAIAHRTSPTNIGLMLLSALCVCDMGIIDSEMMMCRIEKTLDTVEKLDKFRGNLLNWYNTQTLEVLEPNYCSLVDSGNFVCCLEALYEGLSEYSCERSRSIQHRIRKLIDSTDLAFFYDRRRRLFHIGYDLEKRQLSDSYYDLLMSEARMTGFFAVASGQVPKKHWGALGRKLSSYRGFSGPISWTGTMFEYFMPALLLPTYQGTLAFEALRFCAFCQRRRAKKLSRPWGCSESGFYAFDSNLNYQYKAHGIARLALKRHPNDEYVVSPYSSFLTLPHIPEASIKNLEQLQKMGMTGSFGFYEAADFTRSRRNGLPFAVVRSFMAHHIGMSICAIDNALFDQLLCRRFMRGKMGAAKILLQEKIPGGTGVYRRRVEPEIPEKPGRISQPTEKISEISPVTPRAHLLSGGELTLAASDSGLCSCRFRENEVYRPSVSPLNDPQGFIAVVSDEAESFSLTFAPDYSRTATRRAEFAQSYCAYYATGNSLEAGMSVSVHGSLPCEIRSFKLRNISGRRINTNLLLYFEPCMIPRRDALSHPAFGRLFVQSRFSDNLGALVFTRRTREGETPMSIAVGFSDSRRFQYNCSREAVLSRPQGTESLISYHIRKSEENGIPDTCCCMEIQLSIPARSQKHTELIISCGSTEDEALRNLSLCRNQSPRDCSRGCSPLSDGSIEGRLGQYLLPCLEFGSRQFKKPNDGKKDFSLGDLWLLGISGDRPTVIYEADSPNDIPGAHPYIRLHTLFKRLGFEYDLCIVCGEEEVYKASEGLGSDGIYILLRGKVPEKSLCALYRTCVFIAPKNVSELKSRFIPFHPAEILPSRPLDPANSCRLKVHGGYFSDDSFTVTDNPTLPFCNILSNERFGTLVSDKTLGFTFALNSRENRLTPWSNDTRTDCNGEWLTAKICGRFFDPVCGSRAVFYPNRAVYLSSAFGVKFRTTVTVPKGRMQKLVAVEMLSDKPIRVDLAFCTLPTLSFDRRHSDRITVERHGDTVLLSNPFNTAIPGFMGISCSEKPSEICLDLGDLMCGRWKFAGRDINSDLCAAPISSVVLRPGKSKRICFSIGFDKTREGAVALSRDFSPDTEEGFPNLISISTPDPALDVMFNTWLPHQIRSSRINARTAFYQSSGAYGFRDQLQDICALMLLDPERAKRHILLCCERQFEQGDVLHWWHELESGPSGVRTRCSDDMLWLPYSVCEYTERTGDFGILSETVPFLHANELSPDENDRYFSPLLSGETACVFEHCRRAVELIKFGDNGLPLIGTCDWNDGFSGVGNQGRGQSVWLAQFYIIVAEKFASLCMAKSETELARTLLERAEDLRRRIDAVAFENDRYIRAFFDDGSPLGSARCSEDSIDLLPQAFSVLCRMPNSERVRTAVDKALQELVDRENKIIKLFTPPFDKINAGYISAYPKGIRENGGQYTHGAVWLAKALLKLGRTDEGYELICMMNPAYRCQDDKAAEKYMVEPYATAADIYSNPHAIGRGGWTHYTGAAGWLYRTVLSDLLGISFHPGRIEFRPDIPSSWDGFSANIKYLGTEIRLEVKRTGNPSGPAEISLDGSSHNITVEI